MSKLDYSKDSRVVATGNGYRLPSGDPRYTDWEVVPDGNQWHARPVNGESPGVFASTAELAVHEVIGRPA